MSTARSKLLFKEEITVICSYCGILLQGQRLWKHENLNVTEMGSLPVSHGICRDCLFKNFPDEYSALEREGRL